MMLYFELIFVQMLARHEFRTPPPDVRRRISRMLKRLTSWILGAPFDFTCQCWMKSTFEEWTCWYSYQAIILLQSLQARNPQTMLRYGLIPVCEIVWTCHCYAVFERDIIGLGCLSHLSASYAYISVYPVLFGSQMQCRKTCCFSYLSKWDVNHCLAQRLSFSVWQKITKKGMLQQYTTGRLEVSASPYRKIATEDHTTASCISAHFLRLWALSKSEQVFLSSTHMTGSTWRYSTRLKHVTDAKAS